MRHRAALSASLPILLTFALAAALPAASYADTPSILWSWSFVPTPANDNVETVLGVPDLNGDGFPDVLAACEDKTVRALHGHASGSSAPFWTFGGLDEKPFWDETLNLFPDRTEDGLPEILYATGAADHSVHLVRSSDGIELWSFNVIGPATGCGGTSSVIVHKAVSVGDLDGDGMSDVAASVGWPCNLIIALSGADGSLLWQFQGSDGFWSVGAPGDLTRDGIPDVLAGCGSNATGADYRFLLLDGAVVPAAGRVLWQYSATQMVSTVATVQNFSGDKTPEAIGGSWGRSVFAIDGASRGTVATPLWTFAPPGGIGWVSHVLPIPDLDGDCVDEIAVSSWTPQVHVLSGSTGVPVWSQPVWTGSPYGYAASVIPDITGDLQWDLIVGGQQVGGSPGPGFLDAFSGADGVLLWAWASPNNVRTVSWVGDVNDDGLPDVAAGLQDASTVHVFSGRNTGACVRPAFEVNGVRLARLDASRIQISWDPSADPCHDRYRVYAVPRDHRACFATLVDITDQDEDGDASNSSWTGPGDFFGYLVLDQSPAGTLGPLGHFRR